MNDNRAYNYPINSVSRRAEYPFIVDMIPKGKKVIDLASGDGTLLSMLRRKGVSGCGIELSASGVKASLAKGLDVKRGRIDRRIPFPDNHFDYSICNVTLQMVQYPDVLLKEMIRISKRQIVSIPNFAFLPNRLELLFHGRMPRTMLNGDKWCTTGFLHQLSHQDYLDFCQEHHLRLVKSVGMYPPRFLIFPQKLLKLFPNLFMNIGIYLTQKNETH